MSGPAVTLTPVFATPFAIIPVSVPGVADGSLAALLGAFATTHRDAAARPDPLCSRSREELFDSTDERIGVLRREMLAGLAAAVLATNPGTGEELARLEVQARARVAVIRPNGCLPAVSLPLASWCGIYCAAAPAAPAGHALGGVLRLYEPRLGQMFLDGANWRLHPPFAGGHHTWRPVAGHMAAFPAWVAHEVALNRSDRDLVLVIARARFANPGQDTAPPW
jgi:hypothetical protein